MKRMVYLVAYLPFWLTSCEEKVTALHFNEAEQCFLFPVALVDINESSYTIKISHFR